MSGCNFFGNSWPRCPAALASDKLPKNIIQSYPLDDLEFKLRNKKGPCCHHRAAQTHTSTHTTIQYLTDSRPVVPNCARTQTLPPSSAGLHSLSFSFFTHQQVMTRPELLILSSFSTMESHSERRMWLVALACGHMHVVSVSFWFCTKLKCSSCFVRVKSMHCLQTHLDLGF